MSGACTIDILRPLMRRLGGNGIAAISRSGIGRFWSYGGIHISAPVDIVVIVALGRGLDAFGFLAAVVDFDAQAGVDLAL